MKKSDDYEVHNIASFLNVLERMPDGSRMFRGQSRDWPLLPTIARYSCEEEGCEDWKTMQEMLLEEFIKHATPVMGEYHERLTEWLVLAQHHGVPTRLLDFSINPLKALFFAVNDRNYDNEDATFISVLPESWREDYIKSSELSDEKVIAYFPRQTNDRLVVQESCFCVFPMPENKDPLMCLERDYGNNNGIAAIDIVKIKAQNKARLRRELSLLGVNYRTLFPGLDGVAKQVKFDRLNCL